MHSRTHIFLVITCASGAPISKHRPHMLSGRLERGANRHHRQHNCTFAATLCCAFGNGAVLLALIVARRSLAVARRSNGTGVAPMRGRDMVSWLRSTRFKLQPHVRWFVVREHSRRNGVAISLSHFSRRGACWAGGQIRLATRRW